MNGPMRVEIELQHGPIASTNQTAQELHDDLERFTTHHVDKANGIARRSTQTILGDRRFGS